MATRIKQPKRVSQKTPPPTPLIQAEGDTPSSTTFSTSPTQNPTVRVGDFYTNHAGHFQLRLIAGAEGLNRIITEGAVNRLGLALTGFYKYFANHRVQIMGRSDNACLRSLAPELRRKRLREMFAKKIPCVIFSHNIKPPTVMIEEAERYKIPIFTSPMNTLRLMNSVTLWLETDFAPCLSEQGSMVDIQGVGVLIRGESGIGKSECVLGLIERGYSLVADDITQFRCIDGWELIGSSAALTRYYMEVRGIGIINVASIFGVTSIRQKKRLDLVVTLKEWEKVSNIDRIGLDQQFYEILKVRVPHITIPVRSGRDLSGLIEVAALDQKLKFIGQNSATEFNEKLLNRLRTQER